MFLNVSSNMSTILLSMCRLDNLILEAITNLKEPGGCNKTAIASYIEVICYLAFRERT